MEILDLFTLPLRKRYQDCVDSDSCCAQDVRGILSPSSPCMHTRTHARTHAHTHACMHAHTRTHAHTHTRTHARTHTHNTHARTQVHTHACTHTAHVHIRTHARTQSMHACTNTQHTRSYVCTHTCMCAYVHVCMLCGCGCSCVRAAYTPHPSPQILKGASNSSSILATFQAQSPDFCLCQLHECSGLRSTH